MNFEMEGAPPRRGSAARGACGSKVDPHAHQRGGNHARSVTWVIGCQNNGVWSYASLHQRFDRLRQYPGRRLPNE